MMSLLNRRKLINYFALGVSLLAMAFGLFWLFWILWTVFDLGFSALSWDLFIEMTPPPNEAGGGLANAIMGSLELVLIGSLIGIPIGVLTGIYIAEYGGKSWLASSIRFVNDTLLSAPSIVIGLFVYAVYVAQVGKFSAFAGVIALALLEIPVIVRTTENMLLLVPNAMREASFALGAPKWMVIMKVTLKAAMAGMLTGILLAIARVSGETAPLLFTSLSNQFWSTSLNEPIASLPVTIYQFAMSPYSNWISLAWAGVLLITVSVLILNILARVVFRKKVS